MNKPLADFTWEDVVAAPSGFVFADRFDDGIRFLILRGPASVCAYVGVPSSHPLAGHNYNDMPVRAHGGLTFSEEGNGKTFPAGFHWYGWDYAHCDDYATHSDTYPSLSPYKDKGKKWTPQDVNEDSWSTIYDFQHLVKLAEAIAAKVHA